MQYLKADYGKYQSILSEGINVEVKNELVRTKEKVRSVIEDEKTTKELINKKYTRFNYYKFNDPTS